MADSTKKRLITEEELAKIERLAGVGARIKEIAYIIGVSKNTLDRRLQDQPEVAGAIEKGRANAITNVMAAAYKMAVDGKNPSMTMFYLKCRAQWRETSDPLPENMGVLDLGKFRKKA